MVTLRALGVLLLLLLLLLVSGMLGLKPVAEQTNIYEPSRNVCLGLINQGSYETFELTSTAACFDKCGLSESEPCDLGNLQRYWLDFETHLVENSRTETVNLSFVKSVVRNVSTSTPEDLHFSLTPSQIPGQVTEGMHNQFPDRVRLPRSLFASLQDSRSEVRLAVSVLDIGSGHLFKSPQLSLENGSSVFNSRLVGVSLGHMRVTGLAEPLEITFSHQPQPPNVTLTCVFWDVTKGSTGDWSSAGCSTEPGAKGTTCRCDHLTFFALLLRPTLDEVAAQTLTKISQAGCGTSMVFLAFTIVLYAALRFYGKRFQSEDAPKIHVALSASLLLLNLAFFVAVGHGPGVPGVTCAARGALFHYLLLCVFTWMALEAFHLYLLAIRVYNTYFGHYFLKLGLAGWGLPALMVIGTGSASSYGLYSIRDQDNRTTLQLCWFHEETATIALYVTVHGYFLVTYLFNAVVLGLVAWKIFTLSGAMAGKERRQNWKAVLTVLGLSSLVGMTWGLAILTPLGLATVYIFALVNSFQGVFIFCWFIVLYFPSQRTASSGTARVEQTHVASQE